jgi:hypothetical protein
MAVQCTNTLLQIRLQPLSNFYKQLAWLILFILKLGLLIQTYRIAVILQEVYIGLPGIRQLPLINVTVFNSLSCEVLKKSCLWILDSSRRFAVNKAILLCLCQIL